MITLLLSRVGLSGLLFAGAGGAAMWLATGLYDELVDDPAVARRARADYVKMSEYEAERKKREASELLARLRDVRIAELEAISRANSDALAAFEADQARAQRTEQELKDEIETLREARPADVCIPSLRQLGIGDRLRQR